MVDADVENLQQGLETLKEEVIEDPNNFILFISSQMPYPIIYYINMHLMYMPLTINYTAF